MKTSKLWFLLPWSLAIACSDDITEAESLSATGGSSSLTDPDDSSGASNTITDSMSDSMTDSLTADGSSSSSATSADSTSTTTDGDTTTTGTDTGSDTSAGSESDSGSESESGTTGGASCMDDAFCDDFLPCNGTEVCVGGECAPGDDAIVCDDGVPCTVDACDENTAQCLAVAVDDNCDDGSFCNGAESCDPVAGCQAGTPIMCSDGVDCTEDSCDDGLGACAFAPADSNCDDGSFCNGAETCDALSGCQDDTDFSCADLVACTLDTCDEANDECDHGPDDSVCGDGVLCNGDEVCDPLGGCGAGTPVNCGDDGIQCTVESCDEETGQCATELDNSQCDAGEFCSDLGCILGDPCNNAAQCQDGIACNGVETCAPAVPMGPNVCQAGTAIECNDNIACTADSCDEPGICSNVPLNGLCSDQNPCDGTEVCVPGNGCQEGAALDCNDGVSCTIDLCINGFGCNNIADDNQCDDGLFCNGVESCDLLDDCQAAQPIDRPDDGIACTNDACSEQANGCVHEPDDAMCGCGEECLPAIGGCGSDCNLALCDGHLYNCGDCSDNDADCDVDDQDANCFGPCSDNEDGLDGLIPGQDNAPCKHDCYWDGNSGSGNDDCYWSHECDPLEPSATTCEYDANASIPGYGGNNDCTNALNSQSAECESFCEELAPNGCDCFGCCEVDVGNGISVTVYLGSKVDGDGDSTCDVENLQNPDACHPCTQVPACINTCDDCEICFGDDGELPPECGGEQVCAVGQQPCGQVGQEACPEGEFCLTGCCQQF